MESTVDGAEAWAYFAGFGRGSGTAWFDDLNLVEVGLPTR
jgi:hypothetical protein